MRRVIVLGVFVLTVIQLVLIANIATTVIKGSSNFVDHIKTNGLKSVISEIWEGENSGN